MYQQSVAIRWSWKLVSHCRLLVANCFSWNCSSRGRQGHREGTSPFLSMSWSIALYLWGFMTCSRLIYSPGIPLLPQKTSWCFMVGKNFSCSFCKLLHTNSASCRAEWPGWEHGTLLHSNFIVILGLQAGRFSALVQWDRVISLTGRMPTVFSCSWINWEPLATIKSCLASAWTLAKQ